MNEVLPLRKVQVFRETSPTDLPWSVVGIFDDAGEEYVEGIEYFDTWDKALAFAVRLTTRRDHKLDWSVGHAS